MRMSVKDQSVLQKRAAAGSILRLAGAWGRKPTNKQKHLLGPRCPACDMCSATKCWDKMKRKDSDLIRNAKQLRFHRKQLYGIL